MNNIIQHIYEIINSRCRKIPNSNFIQYTDTYFWSQKQNQSFIEGFKQNYPQEFQEEFNDIFDELHPY
jgi:hypothetical protein